MSEFKVGQVVKFLGGPYGRIVSVRPSINPSDKSAPVYTLNLQSEIMDWVMDGALKALTTEERGE